MPAGIFEMTDRYIWFLLNGRWYVRDAETGKTIRRFAGATTANRDKARALAKSLNRGN